MIISDRCFFVMYVMFYLYIYIQYIEVTFYLNMSYFNKNNALLALLAYICSTYTVYIRTLVYILKYIELVQQILTTA
jgi:hypothetical protein